MIIKMDPLLIPAGCVRQAMNRHGMAGEPFLFGIDFEMKQGFFIDHPLENKEILFSIGEISNVGKDTALLSTPSTMLSGFDGPQLRVFPMPFEEYRSRFAIAHAGLLRGDSYLLNLTLRTPISTNLSLEQIFCRSKAAYRICLPGRFVCFSPESFVRIEGSSIRSFPMKGTIDASLPEAEKQLMGNYKEQCEHYTIVDLIRNDLNRIAANVRVERFRYIEKVKSRQGEILQSSSEIRGTLPGNWNENVGDLIFGLLPAGSISGAPKSSTVRLIQKAEAMPRGFYTGVFGLFDGISLDSAVMIRYIEQDGENRMYFRSGGGLTINSQAEDEYREVIQKIYLPII